MIDAPLLYPTLEIILCDLIREIEYGMIRFQKSHLCILIGNPAIHNVKFKGTNGLYVTGGCIILYNEISSIVHIFHELVIILAHPAIGIISPNSHYDRIKLLKIISG